MTDPVPIPRVGPFRLVRRLGEGGMGAVYLAEQENLDRLVAIKLLHPSQKRSSLAAERFRREALTVARLNHPHIVTILDASEDEGIPYIAMEYVPGRGLDEILQENAKAKTHVELTVAVRWCLGIAFALQCAHEAGIIHRDVKPSNIRITPEGKAVLLDFGMARDFEFETLTLTGGFGGTPLYASPEQVAPERLTIDARTDIYSLGVTLYECVTGVRPYGGETTIQVLHQILHREPAPPRRHNPQISRDLETVILTAMEKRRERRYASAQAFAHDLEALLTMRPVKARPLGVVGRTWRRCRRRPAAALAVILSGLLVLGGPASVATYQTLAKNQIDEELGVSNQKLQELLRLSSIVSVRKLEQECDTLWPQRLTVAPAMRHWLQRAHIEVESLPQREHELQDLELGSTADSTWKWRRETTAELVRCLTEINTRIPEVEKRLSIAESVREATVDAFAKEWKEAIEDIALIDAYVGLEITPQVGLVPLEPDDESGLWEFWVWESGERPRRNAESGKWVMAEETGMVLVLIPGGTCDIGASRDPESTQFDKDADNHEEPVRTIELSPYFLSKFEMTLPQWQRSMQTTPNWLQFDIAKCAQKPPHSHPVESMNWLDAIKSMNHWSLSLPTEAQWEYAARAGTSTPWWIGSDKPLLKTAENLADQSYRKSMATPDELCEEWDDGMYEPASIGLFRPNPFGLFDVLGNVSEWCRDGWSFYDRVPARSGDGERVDPRFSGKSFRGGSYKTSAIHARASKRKCCEPDANLTDLGVRPARAVDS